MVKIAIFAILAILPPGACPSGTVRATRPGPQDRQVRAPDPTKPSGRAGPFFGILGKRAGEAGTPFSGNGVRVPQTRNPALGSLRATRPAPSRTRPVRDLTPPDRPDDPDPSARSGRSGGRIFKKMQKFCIFLKKGSFFEKTRFRDLYDRGVAADLSVESALRALSVSSSQTNVNSIQNQKSDCYV